MTDVFEPRNEPARSIYMALRNEAAKRRGRTEGEWIAAERQAVFNEACLQAEKLKLRMPTMDDVVRAERIAVGATDYGAKWANGVTEAMRRR